MSNVRKKEQTAILQSLRAGVVPRVGQQHIQVGRAKEVSALLQDVDNIIDGGASIRFVIGEYGAGKTFFLNLIYALAMEKKLVTAHADLNPDRRLHATGGQARSLYAELMRNLSTRTKPEGGALASIAERFITDSLKTARESGIKPEQAIMTSLESLTELVGGYDFAQVIEAYWKGHDTGNDQLKIDAVRWLRAEFTTKTDARNALGVRNIITDATIYDHLKLMARFIKLAGFNGFLVGFDELVNLYKLSSTQARKSNYEQILRFVNDTLQGSVEHLGVMMGGTPEFLMDPRRGLYSYEALQTRLAENTFANDQLTDTTGPVIRLANLTQEDLYILLTKIRHVMALGDVNQYLVPDVALKQFLKLCYERIGSAYFTTPRNTIKAFVHLLSILQENPHQDWQGLIGKVELQEETNPDLAPLDDVEGDADNNDDSLATFRI